MTIQKRSLLLKRSVSKDHEKLAPEVGKDSSDPLIAMLTQCPLPIIGDRGYNYAEVTAGGVPLDELHLETMESRICRGLYLCGELCDVDGRIGGYNFQWAWSSGYVAGISAARSLTET